jgi:DNA mismatch repair protein MutS2
VRIKELSFDLTREGYERVAQKAREFADFGEEVISLSVLDDDGRLYDSASNKLAEIRGNLAAAKRQARAIGQKILSDQSLTSKLQDQVITLRNDRYVVLVKKESRTFLSRGICGLLQLWQLCLHGTQRFGGDKQ